MPIEVTTFYKILQVVRDAGHTSLTIDEVAVDYELKKAFGFHLNDPIKLEKAPQS